MEQRRLSDFPKHGDLRFVIEDFTASFRGFEIMSHNGFVVARCESRGAANLVRDAMELKADAEDAETMS